MARPATRDELDAARRELDEANRMHGFRRSESSTALSGGSESPRANESNVAQPPATNSTQAGPGGETAGTTPADPGPPRFLGVDLENRVAGVSGGAVFSISEKSYGKIVALLIGDLRANMAKSLAAVADTHKHKVAASQLEIPFEQSSD